MVERPKRKILVVDDNFDMRMILRLTLERAGWSVVDAENGIEAVDKALKELPDLIMMDYNMPEMDGITACHHITTSPESAHIPVIVYTGAFTEQTRMAALAAGAAEFMSKPLLPAELRHKVEAIYSRFHETKPE